MNKLFTLAAIASLMMISIPSNAYAEKTTAVVDLVKIITQSKAGTGIKKQLLEKKAEYQKTVTQKEADLKSKEKDLLNKKKLTKEDVFNKEAAAFKEEVSSTKTFVHNLLVSLEKAQTDSMQKVSDKTIEIIKELAAKNKYSLVVRRSVVVYLEDSIDITDVVLEELNKKLPSVKISF